MRKPKVFISHWMPEIGVNKLREHCEVDYYNGAEPLSPSEFTARAKDADAVLVFMCDTINREVLDQCPNLRVVSSFGKGFDNIDVAACTERNILVTINPAALTDSTADIAMGLLLTLSRNLLAGDRHVRSGNYFGWHATNLLGRDFHHSTLGIIGFGEIGQAISRRSVGFDVKILYTDVRQFEAEAQSVGAEFVDMGTLLAESDFVIAAVNLTPDTYHLLGREQLQMMKDGSFLINICRGSVVDEAAVAEALQSGKLQGYAADVFEFEDRLYRQRSEIEEMLLRQTEKTVFSPHIGTGTIEARQQLAVSSTTQLLTALNGEIPTGAVNKVPLRPLIGNE